MCIHGSIELQYFAYLLIIMYDYIVMHLNFRGNYTQIGFIHAYISLHSPFTLLQCLFNISMISDIDPALIQRWCYGLGCFIFIYPVVCHRRSLTVRPDTARWGCLGGSALHERISLWIGGASYVTTYRALGEGQAVDAEVSRWERVGEGDAGLLIGEGLP